MQRVAIILFNMFVLFMILVGIGMTIKNISVPDHSKVRYSPNLYHTDNINGPEVIAMGVAFIVIQIFVFKPFRKKRKKEDKNLK